MLIRSQDKKALVDMSGTTIRALFPLNNKPKLIAYGNNQSTDLEETLGVYDSKGRAIDILDEISKCYENYSRRYGWDCSEYAVYEMPEE